MVTADDTGHESKFQTDNNKPFIITIHLTQQRTFESVSGVDCNSLTGARCKIMAFLLTLNVTYSSPASTGTLTIWPSSTPIDLDKTDVKNIQRNKYFGRVSVLIIISKIYWGSPKAKQKLVFVGNISHTLACKGNNFEKCVCPQMKPLIGKVRKCCSPRHLLPVFFSLMTILCNKLLHCRNAYYVCFKF